MIGKRGSSYFVCGLITIIIYKLTTIPFKEALNAKIIVALVAQSRAPFPQPQFLRRQCVIMIMFCIAEGRDQMICDDMICYKVLSILSSVDRLRYTL